MPAEGPWPAPVSCPAGRHRRWGTNKNDAQKAFFLFAFSKTFTQHYESRTTAYIRDYLPSVEQITAAEGLSVSNAINYVYSKTNLDAPDHRLFGNNIELALSLVQRRTGASVHYADNAPEIDHIFPRSVLAEKGFDPSEIEDIGNNWILPRGINRNKSAKHPKELLKPVDDQALAAALINRASLDYRSFSSFVRDRREALVDRLRQITQLREPDFDILYEEEEEEQEVVQ